MEEKYLINAPAQDKTYNTVCATSKDSDQPAQIRRLIRVFDDRMCLLQPPGYPRTDARESLPKWVYVQADLSLSWLHRSYCRFCHALAQMKESIIKSGQKNPWSNRDYVPLMCASEVSDQPAHSCSLIRIITECILDSQGSNVSFSREQRRLSLDYADAHADLSLWRTCQKMHWDFLLCG